MTILIVLCTALLIIDCALLSLLVLVQLPKKEAGVGLAFGGGATDALFGAGSGTALSNLTKYTATAFFILVFALAVLNNHARQANVSALKLQMLKQAPPVTAPAPVTTPAAPMTSNSPVVPLSSTNSLATNLLAAPAK